jgi:hypothetical protein
MMSEELFVSTFPINLEACVLIYPSRHNTVHPKGTRRPRRHGSNLLSNQGYS